ncbi:MAG TPA: DUF2961 domain-containing protein [Kiritimatiellae bacterium]|nr:DUF2961 domain-containing protein [Kiritimatiellia bacterium]
MRTGRRVGLILILLLGGAGGCSRGPKVVTWRELVGRLADRGYICRIDQPAAQLLSSYDPSGGNEDFNHFVRIEGAGGVLGGAVRPSPGWVVLADLRGPGYLQRFWFTGAKSGDYGLRFFLDGERTPRLETTLKEWCGGLEYTRPPIGAYENYCWYSWMPVPFRKRLVVMVHASRLAEGRPDKLFYQINYARVPRGHTVESFTPRLPPQVRRAVDEVRRRWAEPVARRMQETGAETKEAVISVGPGREVSVLELDGPAIIRWLAVVPRLEAEEGIRPPARALRGLVLRIRWDGSEAPSVEAPLGDFFGILWRPVRYQSFYWGMTNGMLVSLLPMPFRELARISIENRLKEPATIHVKCAVRPVEDWDPGRGYLHAAWRKSGPGEVGLPHLVIEAAGRGRLAALVLGTASRDRSWWMLEGDELIQRDTESEPGWKGTGLEDYFNGGWYYQNALARPLQGIVFKAPFRTAQYRIHQADAVTFQKRIRMVFERGPDNASRGWFESMCFYYLDSPRESGGRICDGGECATPDDGLWNATLMSELLNYERLGDFGAAVQRIEDLLAAVPDFPFADVLRARAAAYRELMGRAECVPVLQKILRATSSGLARSQIKDFLWLRSSLSNALLGVYCNTRVRVFLDGKMLAEEEDARRMHFIRVTLTPGEHVVAVQAARHPYPDWVQVCLRTVEGDVGTGPSWRYRFQPEGDWADPDFDDSQWEAVGGTGVKGPPEAPYLWLEPNIFVGMQSGCVGLRPPVDWPPGAAYVVYRHRFLLTGGGPGDD